MGNIHVLTKDLRNKIAAGEVVERPASVVKELIENSIDAGATEISVIISGGGNASIQVVDNGDGLDSEDLELAFHRHTTSKISKTDDLQSIGTLGFRGEALASIASVAKVRAVSTINGVEGGNEIIISGGVLSDVTPSVIIRGTSVTVSDLFFSIPARRKFLKSPRIELRHILQTVQRFALCYPDIGFKFQSDKKEILFLQPESLSNRIKHIFDPTYEPNLLPVQFEKDVFHVSGFVGNLNLVRKRRGGQYFFLNRRYIVNNLLNSGIYSAYQSLLSRGEFPFFVLNLDMPKDQVDVNVHPTKIEVRFQDEWRVYHVLKSAVTNAISDILSTIPDLSPNMKMDTQSKYISTGMPDFSSQPRSDAQTTLTTRNVERAKDYVKHFTSREGTRQLPELGKIWQVHNKYIISQIKSGLVIIDQHVAHERVLFEQALNAMEGQTVPSQTLLFPQVLEFSAEDFSILIDLLPYIEKIGFRMKEFGKTTLLIEGVPSEIDWGNEKKVLQDIIDYYRNHNREYSSHQEAIAASFACRAAVKAGDELTSEEMRTLIDRLFATKHPYYCPHGRPIIINLSLDELDRRFERS